MYIVAMIYQDFSKSIELPLRVFFFSRILDYRHVAMSYYTRDKALYTCVTVGLFLDSYLYCCI